MDAGCSGFLAKPVDTNYLISTVNQYIKALPNVRKSSEFADRLIAGIDAEEDSAAAEAVKLQSFLPSADASAAVDAISLPSKKEDLYPAKRRSAKKVVGDSVEKLIKKQTSTDVGETASTPVTSTPAAPVAAAAFVENLTRPEQPTSPFPAVGEPGVKDRRDDVADRRGVVRMSQFEYFFHEHMGAIDVAIEKGQFEKLEDLSLIHI